MRSWKDSIVHCLTPSVRAALRYAPSRSARRFLWNHLCRGRLDRRSYRFNVGTKYGRFSGDTSELLCQRVYYFGSWEPTISELINQRLERGQTFVDVGANAGWYTVLAGRRVGPNGRVVAIEASATTFKRLEGNVSMNGLSNVRMLNQAVWSSESWLPLFEGPSYHSGISTVMPAFANRSGCDLAGEVHARPLFEILTAEEVATLRLLKIDVEGAEREVLLGLQPLLDSVPMDFEILLELNPVEYDVSEVLLPFRNRGYRARIIPNDYEAEAYFDMCVPERYVELTAAPSQQVDVLLTRRGQ